MDDEANLAPCALCGQTAPLRMSHILPAFIYRWMRTNSVTGHIRFSENPNKRVQDGLKKPLLCEGCEARFSGDEREFANQLFYPWLSGTHRVPYREWLLRFCVSVSWRVLKNTKGLNPNAQYTAEQEALAAEAETTWRRFLLGQRPHPGKFEQHLLINDIIQDTSVPDLPTNINRYLMGAVELDIVGSERTMMTYAKLGRFMIFGLLQRGPERWSGTKVHVGHGVLKPDTFTIPGGLMYLFREKAGHVAAAYEKLSPAQQAKIDAAFMQNTGRLEASDHFRGMMADGEMFGEQAIIRPRDRAG